MEKQVLTINEIIDLFTKVDDRLNSLENIIHFVKSKKEPNDDEAVYLSETRLNEKNGGPIHNFL